MEDNYNKEISEKRINSFRTLFVIQNHTKWLLNGRIY